MKIVKKEIQTNYKIIRWSCIYKEVKVHTVFLRLYDPSTGKNTVRSTMETNKNDAIDYSMILEQCGFFWVKMKAVPVAEESMKIQKHLSGKEKSKELKR